MRPKIINMPIFTHCKVCAAFGGLPVLVAAFFDGLSWFSLHFVGGEPVSKKKAGELKPELAYILCFFINTLPDGPETSREL